MYLIKMNALCAAVLTICASSWAEAATPVAPSIQTPISAPYLDVTVWPTPPVDTIGVQNGLNQMTLAFVTNNPHAPQGQQCAPAWAGSYPIDGTLTDSTSKYISDSIHAYQAAGGDVIISFGGEAGSLAPSCSTSADMEKALETVVDANGVRHLDFDIEGAYASIGNNDPYHINLRSQAIAALQQAQASKNAPVDISLTLPIMPTGLTNDGLNVLDSAIANGVALSRVNGMTMDYGIEPPPEMGTAAEQAATALQGQIVAEYKKYGITVAPATAAAMVGITPMIGQNDAADEQFTLDDANTVLTYAQQQNVGELAFWSLNRDLHNCSANGLPACSMVPENNYQFATTFAAYGGALNKVVPANPSYRSPVVNGGGGGGGSANCSTTVSQEGQPWDPTLIYNSHDTATYGNPPIQYTASYWTCGDQPDTSQAWVAPPSSTPQPWNASKAYNGGDKVTLNSHPWTAAYWNQNDQPGTDTAWIDNDPPTGPQQWVKTMAYPGGMQVIDHDTNWTANWYANPGDEPYTSHTGAWSQK